MPDITVSAVTLTGKKHEGRKIPCEDYSLAVQRDGVSCVVVCDGAGSKQYTHARFGSKSACETVSELLIDNFDALYDENREAAVRSVIIAAVHIGFSHIMEHFKLDKIDRLSCTLLFCAVKDRRVLAGHIGDGLIAAVSSSGVRPLTMPQSGADASSTYFVTAPHAADYLRLIKTTVDDLHGIALMTDGVQDNVYDENSGLVKPVIARMVETCAGGREKSEQEIRSILGQYIVGASNNSDDASFGIVYFNGTQGPDAGKLKKDASQFPRSVTTFKDLQKEMLPEVKRAKSIMDACASNPAPEQVPDGVEGPAEKTVIKAPVKVPKRDDKEYAAPETPLKIDTGKKSGSGFMLKLIALIELAAIIALLIKILFFKG